MNGKRHPGSMKLIIHRGSKQIGGSCIEVSTAKTRVILDVGAPLEYPAQLLQRSQSQRKRPADLPAVPGLFDDGAKVDGVLLSHAHGDHTGMLEWVNADTPIYLSKGTSKMLLASSIFAGQAKLDRKRQRILDPNTPKQIGDITVTALPVDHSAFDSMALLIEADGKRLLYSGDLRMHGRKPGMAREIFRIAKEKPIDLLLMEGTNLREPEPDSASRQTEQELENTLFDEMRDCPGLVLANFSPQHVDRMVSFYKATRRAGREFVADVYAAFVLHLVSGQCRVPKPVASAGIRVYYNQSFVRTWRKRNLKKIHDLFLQNRIELSAILSEPERFVIAFRPSMMKYDFNGGIPQRTKCLYSYWPGYLMRPEYCELREVFDKAQGDFSICHTSGHIFPEDLVKFLSAVNARQVVPVHTTMPHKFSLLFRNVRVLSDGEVFEVGG